MVVVVVVHVWILVSLEKVQHVERCEKSVWDELSLLENSSVLIGDCQAQC